MLCAVVSTHSRLKAAGPLIFLNLVFIFCFNTQPPKGGWGRVYFCQNWFGCFNTQPPKGGWGWGYDLDDDEIVSTHSRLKAAGKKQMDSHRRRIVSTHSRLKAAGYPNLVHVLCVVVSTHSRLKAAGDQRVLFGDIRQVSTHSRLKAAGIDIYTFFCNVLFQHTAA